MVVPITDVVKMTLSVADISVEPIIGTPLLSLHDVVFSMERIEHNASMTGKILSILVMND